MSVPSNLLETFPTFLICWVPWGPWLHRPSWPLPFSLAISVIVKIRGTPSLCPFSS
jgi:hypothetical protein